MPLIPDSDRSDRQLVNDHNIWGFVIVMAIFCGGYVICATLAAKMVTLFGFTFSVGVFAYSLTFPCTDIVGEVYGHKYAKKLVWGGFIAVLAATLIIQLSFIFPASDLTKHPEAYHKILGSTPRIVAASLVTYLIAQNLDVYIFAAVRRLFGERNLWLRNNVSTIVSQGIDTVVFFSLAFYGVFPLTEVIIGSWLAKVAIAFIDTPLVYLGVWAIRKHSPDLKVR